MSGEVSPILLEVFKNRFSSIAEEMGTVLTQTAFSPNIKERRDLSCAIFDAGGDMIAQAAHIPVHLGSMPLSVKAAISAFSAPDHRLLPGDMVMLNNPFEGGTHLPDITLVAPVFAPRSDTPDFFVANRAHHADVGGMAPGSMPLSTSLFQEGVIIPPTRIISQGNMEQGLMRFLLANVRTPQEREGDFAAQIMANTTGVNRLGELLAAHGLDTVARYGQALCDYAETLMRSVLRSLPDGTYAFEDVMESDGQGSENIPVRLELTISDDSATLDFSGSGDQVRGSVNAVRAITLSGVLYVFRALAGSVHSAGTAQIPTNAGLMRPLTVITRHGSILDARFPAAVAAGNVETSQRVVDVILGALAQTTDQAPAASQGTMNNLTMGGTDPRTGTPFAYYETIAGGMGAGATTPGESGVHSHMTNTLNTPVEALEYAYPFRVRELSLRSGSGGKGANPGGNGLVRDIEVLAETEVTVLSERREKGAWGLHGGHSGQPGKNTIQRDDTTQAMPGKFQATLRPGERIRMETPGGGAYGLVSDSQTTES